MEYRTLPHGGEKISVIGMGSSVVGEQKEADIIRTVEYALDVGINYFDMAGGHATIFPAYGKALEGRRNGSDAPGAFRGQLYDRGIWLDDKSRDDQALGGLAAEKPQNGLH